MQRLSQTTDFIDIITSETSSYPPHRYVTVETVDGGLILSNIGEYTARYTFITSGLNITVEESNIE